MFLPAYWADLVHLVERVDDVADYANGSARLVVVFPEAPPEPLREGITKFGGLLLQATQQLADALDKLTEGDRRAALELRTVVERAEEEADAVKASLYKQLFAMDRPPGRCFCFAY